MIFKTTILFVLVGALIFADTVEDREAPSVVDNLAPSVIKMPEQAVQRIASFSKVPDEIMPENNESAFEMVNGVLRKKIKNIEEPTHIELEDEAKEVENLEPDSLITFE
jgi:hypothetical protein